MSSDDVNEANGDEKYEGIDEEDSIVFGGQIPRAATQVTGLTNIEKSKTLMTLSTAKVNTKADGHSKPSAYVPSSDLFKFSNPDRPDDDLQTAKNQTYNGQPLSTSNAPTFSRPTVARSPGIIHSKYAQHLTFVGDNSQQILFGRFRQKSSCCMLICSTILSLLFSYVAIVFFPSFVPADCPDDPYSDPYCLYTSVEKDQFEGILKNEVTLISACDKHNYLMFSFKDQDPNDTITEAYTFSEIQDKEIDLMYVGGTDITDVDYIKCWDQIHSEDQEAMNGYVVIDIDEYQWDLSARGWFLILSLVMALFFILIEWLFYSYNEIMIPRKDYRAYIMWYLIRIGWMSWMFAIIIAHSLVIDGDITFMVGNFEYVWVNADSYIATGFFGLFTMICLCCCCFQESEGFSVGGRGGSDDLGFERYFLPQSRMDMLVINDFEQGLGTAMCTTMIFVIGFIICGCVPFVEFLSAGVTGYTYFPYIASVWFLAIIAMTFQMCWFVRARCCGDDEDKRQAQIHDVQIQRAATAPSIR